MGTMGDDTRSPIVTGVLAAAASAVAFGATTPVIAHLGGGASPWTTAALLYAGASAVSLALRPVSRRSGRSLGKDALGRLLLVGVFGAALAPALLVWGLRDAGATSASLVLNFEAVFTVMLAWVMYREAIGRRVSLALMVMLVGGALVAWDGWQRNEAGHALSLLAVLGATACWAFDNALTRELSDRDPLDVVATKGALGASISGALALAFGESAPTALVLLGLLLCGATGYGLSLRLYLVAQRRMGAARTASVFAAGPFVGAALGWLLGDRTGGFGTIFGAVAFGVGVYLHATERHAHRHVHPALEHEHAHRHDDGHHDHVHDPPVSGEHTHRHRHEAVEHEHEHAPDVHHGHSHS
jgi:drug/metabolite transporter (DMT)-like permease